MEGLGRGLFTKSPRWHSSLLSEAWTTGWLLQNQLGSVLKYYLGDLLPLCIYTWESGLAHRILPSQQGFLIFLLNERVVIINRDWFWKAAFCFVIYGAEEKSLSYLFLKTRCYIFLWRNESKSRNTLCPSLAIVWLWGKFFTSLCPILLMFTKEIATGISQFNWITYNWLRIMLSL